RAFRGGGSGGPGTVGGGAAEGGLLCRWLPHSRLHTGDPDRDLLRVAPGTGLAHGAQERGDRGTGHGQLVGGVASGGDRVSVVRINAPAKVNLWLHILAREDSGYHSLETLFCAIDLADELTIARGGRGITLQVEGGIETGPPTDNLVVRAARRFLDEVGRPDEGLSIELHKRIPAAAGLGGGSSDAAATLRALNRLFGGPLAEE